MSSTPEYRLINLRRRLDDLVRFHRLSARPDAGVVELRDFGKQCEELAAFGAETAAEFRGCVRWLAEETELAARLAARLETLQRTPQRVERQAAILEEPLRGVEAALRSGCELMEAPALLSLSTLARREREFFEPLVEFEGRIEESPAGLVDRGPVRRALRRALLEHEEGAFLLEVSREGLLRFCDVEVSAEPAGETLVRGPGEPPEVKKALDLFEAADDEALRDFLLVKAVDEALLALVAPKLSSPELVERARALPQKPGKRAAVRREAVALPIEGWSADEAARGAEKLAARRIGPDWARLPRGAYLLRLFLSADDALAADLLALGPALRRMEKSEPVQGTRPAAGRALRGLLGLLG